ncbi:hypothetical protein [Sediminibacillus massiliensis]|uniref:hypothetical protein n=1 Tax=Sediminibacillus massiliensis TaxID=1926277 RepID=UPI00098858B6|nr:hypothetical protein [Sediminibacillus massiliensis]
MTADFETFLDNYLSSWKKFSLSDISEVEDESYQAREITGDSKIVDFGYEESIDGWDQAFSQLKGNAEWVLKKVAVIPLRDKEIMAVISATLIIDSNQIETANLFFQTFKKVDGKGWKLVRSYIEAGIPLKRLELIKQIPST